MTQKVLDLSRLFSAVIRQLGWGKVRQVRISERKLGLRHFFNYADQLHFDENMD